MSATVFLIGAVHAIPPIAGAAMTSSKGGVWVGAAIAVFIAFASGNISYIFYDLVGASVGTLIGFESLKK